MPCMDTNDVLKLSRFRGLDGACEVRVEGRLDADSVRELRAFLGWCADDNLPALNLTGLRSVDREGRDYLLSLLRRGFVARGASLYLKHILGEAVT